MSNAKYIDPGKQYATVTGYVSDDAKSDILFGYLSNVRGAAAVDVSRLSREIFSCVETAFDNGEQKGAIEISANDSATGHALRLDLHFDCFAISVQQLDD